MTATPANQVDIGSTPLVATDRDTKRTVQEVHDQIRSLGHLPVWCITRNPSDFPGKFVVRMNVAARSGQHYASSLAVVAYTLEGVRDVLPHGLYRFDRDPTDDPVIVESWL